MNKYLDLEGIKKAFGENVYCYFENDTLVRIIKEHPEYGYNILIVKKISSTVDEKIFKF